MTPLPLGVRARILFRSLGVQGSWNYETLIGTGFAYTIIPALRYLHGGDGDKLDAAALRHANLFNSHPYFATVAIGAICRLEAERAEPAVIERFKSALRGSLGSLGDRLVWTTWRPMALLVGIALLLAGAAWWVAVVAFLAIYNALHLTVRIVGFRIGSSAGLEIGRVLREAPVQTVVRRASQVGCFVAGIALVLAAAPAAREPIASAATVLSIVVGLWLGSQTRRLMISILAGFSVLALLLGLTGYGG